MSQKVFVYGTLKRDQGNHGVLSRNKGVFLGEATLPGYTLLDLGPFPGAVPNQTEEVRGEVFEVSDDVLSGPLDGLEGCRHPSPGGLYRREEADHPEHGKVWIYLINSPRENLPSGPVWP